MSTFHELLMKGIDFSKSTEFAMLNHHNETDPAKWNELQLINYTKWIQGSIRGGFSDVALGTGVAGAVAGSVAAIQRLWNSRGGAPRVDPEVIPDNGVEVPNRGVERGGVPRPTDRYAIMHEPDGWDDMSPHEQLEYGQESGEVGLRNDFWAHPTEDNMMLLKRIQGAPLDEVFTAETGREDLYAYKDLFDVWDEERAIWMKDELAKENFTFVDPHDPNEGSWSADSGEHDPDLDGPIEEKSPDADGFLDDDDPYNLIHSGDVDPADETFWRKSLDDGPVIEPKAATGKPAEIEMGEMLD